MKIVYEDQWFLVVAKTNQESVQPDLTKTVSLVELLRSNYPLIAPINRVDKVVGGLVLFGKNPEAQNKGREVFTQNNTSKKYLAITSNKLQNDSGVLEHYIKRDGRYKKSFVKDEKWSDAKLSRLRYRLLDQSDTLYCWDIELLTGRFHQIRSQLAHMGCPIRGDRKYGYQRYNKGGGIHLHSYYLSFHNPFVNKQITIFDYPLDDAIWDLFIKNIVRKKEVESEKV
ncbi:RluA family pseudouridine synthase [Spirochaeta cellobiosiphila]|uniref:RluA family pseudouridine synthase n=1 Tax=Spirochaeta cellobiosiphila TaxID=504483 RepID=UPI00048E795D|nr:RluA family pseudouridine synthase [Spirochaeta cellobiosiphila]